MSEVISSYKSLGAESQVFALLMLFICVILHIMWSGKSLPLLCILPFGMLFIIILIIITIPYYSDSIYVEYLMHMTCIRTIKIFIQCKITTHEYVY